MGLPVGSGAATDGSVDVVGQVGDVRVIAAALLRLFELVDVLFDAEHGLV